MLYSKIMANYSVSEDGIKLLIEFEGEVLSVYKDPVGLPTLGVGHLVKPDEKANYPVGKKITKEESRKFLRNDLKKFEACVNNAVTVPITQNQFDALVSLAFNIGEGGFKRSSVLRNLNNRKFDAAADAFLAWNKAGGKVLPGLTRRRNAERSIFLTPDEAQLQPQAKIAIPKPESVGFMKGLYLRITGILGTNIGFETFTSQAQQVGALGLSPATWQKIGYALAVVGVVLIGAYIYSRIEEKRRNQRNTEKLMELNSTPDNIVELIDADMAGIYEAQGYKVIAR